MAETGNQAKGGKLSVNGITVVSPCLNEEESIGLVVDAAKQGIARTGLPGEVLVVDNASKDRSAEVARAHGARVILEQRRGYGAALRAGFEAAAHDILVMGDGDLTYDFGRLDDLVLPIVEGRSEFVIGNRLRNVKPGAMPTLHRYIGTPMISWLMRFMFRSKAVRDPNCGMRAILKTTYRRLRCVTTGMEFASEMIVQAIRNNVTMLERDIVYHPRTGVSKLRTFKDGWRHLRFMMLYSPTMMLLLPGVLFWVMSLLLAAPLAAGPIMIETRRVDIHFMIMAGLINIVSLQVITIGLLAKAYAHLSGLRYDPVVAWFYRWFSFERAVLVAAPLAVLGLFVCFRVIFGWVGRGFGTLDEARPLFFAAMCLVNGVQMASSAYLFSIMALPRHLEELPKEAVDTGIADR